MTLFNIPWDDTTEPCRCHEGTAGSSLNHEGETINARETLA